MDMLTPVLDRLVDPSDIRALEKRDLNRLADEVRAEIISAAAETGGHFGAGLGVVELTVALPGAMIGGVLIGLIEVLFAAYFSSEYKDVAAFSMLIIVLIFMPQGLLGRPEIEKV